MLFHKLFPEHAKQMLGDLRRLKRRDLAEQVMNLRIVDRCRCGLEACGTFYTQDAEYRQRRQSKGVDLLLRCGISVTDAGGTIVEVETLDPKVEAALRRYCP